MGDMREFLEVLAENDDLLLVGDHVSVQHDIAWHIRQTCDYKGPALMFMTVKSFPGKKVVGSLYGTRDRVIRILGNSWEPHTKDKVRYGLTESDSDLPAVKRYCEYASVDEGDSLSDRSILIGSGAPCQEVVMKGNDVNLYDIPICVHNELDKGPFITAGVNVVKWFHGDVHGLGMHRMMLVSRNELSCLAPINRRVGFPHYRDSRTVQHGVKMAVVVGAPPEVVLASQSKINSRSEKYIVAANMMHGKGIRLARCVTSDLFVPADAELVLECTTIPNSSYDDTPFGEYPGTYSYRSTAFLVKVDAVTTRKDYIYQTVLTGKVPQEDSNLCAIPYAAEVYRVSSRLVEEVTDIAAYIGNNVFDTIVCIKKNSNEEVQNLMHQLLGNKYLKSVTIMDHDMKATEECWRFCFNTRYQPNRDTIVTNLALGASLDPSSPLFQSTSKIGFDFTVPIGKTPIETKTQWQRHTVADVPHRYSINPRFWEVQKDGKDREGNDQGGCLN
jgi:2,5-furandicarboxylate decarboxylase 1